jgi:hypothetical protein
MLGPVPYWLLGLLALAVVWTAALLCALASVSYARMLGKKADSLRPRLAKAVVVSGLGEGDVFAAHEIEQIGRALDGDLPGIAFSDKAYRARIFGGVLSIDGKDVEIAEDPREDAPVWTSETARQEAAKVEGDERFDGYYKDARGSKGSPRVVTTRLSAGDTVYIAREASGEVSLVSAIDPLEFYAARRRAHWIFALVELAVCAALTRVALHPPVFELVSTLGGAALLGFFLGVQPIGVSVEEGSREPFRAYLRGTHKRTAPFPGGIVPGRTTTEVTNG